MFPSIRRLLGMGFQATERVHPALVQSRTLEIITYPRTMLMTHADTSPCLYPSMPGEHLLKCGHSINTTLPEPCGRNCQHIGNAIADPEGFEGAKERVGFYCQACVEEVIEMKVQKYTNPRERNQERKALQIQYAKRDANTTRRPCYIGRKNVAIPCDVDGRPFPEYQRFYECGHPLDTTVPPMGANMFKDRPGPVNKIIFHKDAGSVRLYLAAYYLNGETAERWHPVEDLPNGGEAMVAAYEAKLAEKAREREEEGKAKAKSVRSAKTGDLSKAPWGDRQLSLTPPTKRKRGVESELQLSKIYNAPPRKKSRTESDDSNTPTNDTETSGSHASSTSSTKRKRGAESELQLSENNAPQQKKARYDLRQPAQSRTPTPTPHVSQAAITRWLRSQAKKSRRGRWWA